MISQCVVSGEKAVDLRSEVQEETSDRNIAGGDALSLGVYSGTGGDDDVEDKHADSGCEPKESSTESLDKHRAADGEKPVPDLQAAVQSGLSGRIREAERKQGKTLYDTAIGGSPTQWKLGSWQSSMR
jgi:hypothetical protein